MSKEFKILVIKMSSMGDIIHSWPFAVALRKNWPQAHITWAVNEEYQDLIPGDYVDELLIIDRKRLFKFSYWRELRNKFKDIEYDWIIDLQAILKSSIISLLANGKKRYSYCDAKEGSWLVSKPLRGKYCQDNVVERYLDVIRCLGREISNVEYPSLDFSKYLNDLKLKTDFDFKQDYVVMVPLTRWKNKNWNMEYYAEFGEYLCKKYKFPVVLLGGASDYSKLEELSMLKPKVKWINLASKTNLLEMFAVILNAKFFIGSDSGPTHFASAAQTPMIALYGATYPTRSAPYANPNARIILSPIAPKENGKLSNRVKNVMSGITPEMVIKVYENMKASMKDD